MVRLAVRTRSALICAVRPKTAPNDLLRGLLGGGCAGSFSFSFSVSVSALPASLLQRLPRCDFPVLMNDAGGGVAGAEGELVDDVTDVDEWEDGQGDVDGARPGLPDGTGSVVSSVFVGETATGIPCASGSTPSSGSVSDDSSFCTSCTMTSWMECTVARGSSCE